MISFLPLLVAASSAPSPLRHGLEPWAMFIGQCWSGPSPGNQGIDTHCFEPVFGGQHVRDHHSVKVKGKAVYEGETLYSVDGAQISFTYWNSLGGVGRGTVIAQGDKLHFTGTMRGSPESISEPMDVEWNKIPTGYEVEGPKGTPARVFKRVSNERIPQ